MSEPTLYVGAEASLAQGPHTWSQVHSGVKRTSKPLRFTPLGEFFTRILELRRPEGASAPLGKQLPAEKVPPPLLLDVQPFLWSLPLPPSKKDMLSLSRTPKISPHLDWLN